MPTLDTTPIDLETRPLTPERWPDLERIVGQHDAYGGCWHMGWRLTHHRATRVLSGAGALPNSAVHE